MSRFNRSIPLRHAALATSALAGLLFAAPAFAADEDGAAAVATAYPAVAANAGFADEGSEIVVTSARRRDESAQDVPIALSVISAESLERKGDYTLLQVQQQVPSLQVFSFNPRNTNINIRGLGSNIALTNDGLENGVGFYIDNVYYGRVGLSQFDLVDLDRIEVLRGPQGTLFGKNTTSGVVNITSKAPTFSPEFSAEASYGNYDYVQLRASASGAIVPDLVAVRVSGAYTNRDGFLTNTTTHTDAQDYHNVSVRGQILITPASNLDIKLIGDYSQQKQKYALTVFVDHHETYSDGAPIANNFLARAARFPDYTLPSFDPFARTGEADSHYQANMEGYGVSGQIDWDLGFGKVTSITAYRWWDWYPANDGDGLSLPITTVAQQQNFQRQFSQELRLASNGDGPISYVVGGYYFWQTVKGYGSFAYGDDAGVWNRPAASPLSQAVWNGALDGFTASSYSDPITKSLAAFGQVDWKITNDLTLTGGLRFTHEHKEGVYQQWWTGGTDLDNATYAAIRGAYNPKTDYSTSFNDDSLGGLISLAWKVTPDTLLYASYSRGNKSGGLNLTALPAGVTPDVAPEKVDNYETGFKSQFFDRRLTLNGALFWTEITDYQTTITDLSVDLTTYRQYITNIPKVRSRGAEADLSFRATDNFSLFGSVAYTDAKYVEYTNAPQAVEELNHGSVQDLSGAPLPGVPEFAYTIGAEAHTELTGGGLELYGNADWSHRSSFNTSSSNSAWAEVEGYGIVNARIGIRSADLKWDVSVWAKNLFDKDYFTTLSVANTGAVTGQLGDPATYGVTVRTKL
ncbi:MAG: TonB-dependent receptor [Candidatus Andeanibacterium colombiense]|uniref:TonB-dependent receptor n=1 Tax=Candidatus Andeanibacterium colombiense TaxID=3121345 RepID=A0AAJ5X805_9SPHN|nr:MAG: TonB-dependent receptor [Sphingomonadaceae bacterium]